MSNAEAVAAEGRHLLSISIHPRHLIANKFCGLMAIGLWSLIEYGANNVRWKCFFQSSVITSVVCPKWPNGPTNVPRTFCRRISLGASLCQVSDAPKVLILQSDGVAHQYSVPTFGYYEHIKTYVQAVTNSTHFPPTQHFQVLVPGEFELSVTLLNDANHSVVPHGYA